MSVRKQFADRLLQCGIVDRTIGALQAAGSISTVNGLNARFEVGAGGFAGHTNPAYVYTVIDSGPGAASFADIKVVTDSLGYVLSPGSAFLLDADDSASYDFPANYVVLNFPAVPSLEQSAALFETVGEIDPELFSTDTSGYTQVGRAYLSLQSDVSKRRFTFASRVKCWIRWAGRAGAAGPRTRSSSAAAEALRGPALLGRRPALT